MNYIRNSVFLILLIIFSNKLFSQGINIDNYKAFLENNKNMTSGDMRNKYPVGMYQYRASTGNSGICFMDTVELKLKLTNYEKELLGKHNFMVTERHSYNSFWKAYKDVYEKDLPVFISTDAILHAMHMSYDAMLKDLETALIIPKLDTVLKSMHEYAPTLKTKYSDSPEILQAINDYDIYLTIARRLLSKSGGAPVFVENTTSINDLMKMIIAEQFADYPLFADAPRHFDFSQFTIRGHYTDTPELGSYFKSMIWLGRTELYLIPPEPPGENPISPEDVRRQIILSYLILEATENTGVLSKIEEIDKLIKILVGESDNVKINHLKELKQELNIAGVKDLVDMEKVKVFQEHLAQKSYADQKILSQVLFKNPMNPDKIQPASAFLLLGQRFIIDSYVFGNVVWDKTEAKRMLPSTLDVLFALGNNAASEFLKKELDTYKYSVNLAGMRYLIDSYDESFWKESYYNSWLRAIRMLNPPDDITRSKLPKFMQTAAWWQEKMNTQLASWTQLRHDNLLYAKQSYSGGVSCSNPDAYLEPIPEFYSAVLDLANFTSAELMQYLGSSGSNDNLIFIKEKLKSYLERMTGHLEKLHTISEKELNGMEISDEDMLFLRSVYSYKIVGCGEYDHEGWFSDLFYHEDDDAEKPDYLVADVHTAPTDADGNMVGWVLHVGTGEINLGVFVTENSKGELTAFVGPVMSYHENISTNFKRYTDEEWEKGILKSETTIRPEFVNLYLANKNGEGKGSGSLPVSLPVGVTEQDLQPGFNLDIATWPNPFTEFTVITFPVSSANSMSETEVSVYNNNMQLLKTIYNGKPQQGNYSVKWDGTDNMGRKAASGSYFVKITINGKTNVHKLVLVR